MIIESGFASPALGATTPPVIAVLRAPHANLYGPVAETMSENGINAIELTMSTPGAIESIASIRTRVDSKTRIGIGTVTNVSEVHRAVAAGVDFIVTPTTDLSVISAAVSEGIPIYPGGLTPTELWAGWNAGATAVKIFPASVVGPDMIAHLRGPFPDIQVIPSGGIDLAAATAWMAAGALAVSVGGPLVGDAFKGGSLSELATRCRSVLAAVNTAGIIS
ncbi:bifunctional 4-hydroxy-2-oxoglutarate aldolase/2-dehydro-3-deoxy-phosphogluconate aldolase [Rhodococcus erythropolis]|uniref:bifunctional 4-hydroxy-2-oxoglutarate aldolase/2-dehydro-3-deoxy-phosphogluconate aldolase n=1 Tax=Rhodococcus erythropolis TaxID=1833 RepID=UPI0037B161B7